MLCVRGCALPPQVCEEEIWRKQRAEGRTVYEPFETRKVFEEALEWFVVGGLWVVVGMACLLAPRSPLQASSR